MLTDEQVIKARELIASRELSQRQIARLLGISRTMVQTIARGRRQLKVEREPSDEPEFLRSTSSCSASVCDPDI